MVSCKDGYVCNENKGLYRHYSNLVCGMTFSQIRKSPCIYLSIIRLVRNTKTIDGESVNKLYIARYSKVYLVFLFVLPILLSCCLFVKVLAYILLAKVLLFCRIFNNTSICSSGQIRNLRVIK